MPEHVIAMDPGGRSGWAAATMDADRFAMTGGGVLRQDLMEDWFAVQQAVTGPALGKRLRQAGINRAVTVPALGKRPRQAGINRAPKYNVFVYESWRPRRDENTGQMDWIEGSPLLPVLHIGGLITIARLSGATIVEQHPSDKPQALANMPRAILDLDRYSNEQHDKDARMHLWLYFWRQWFSATVHPDDTIVAV